METKWTDPIRALTQWMEMQPVAQTVGDAATLVHLLALSVAVATVLGLDWRIMRAARRALTVHDTSALDRGHRRILAALAAKAVTMVLLTATALAMGRYALPTMAAHTGVPLLALGLATKLRLATLGVLSGAGWVTALVIGASESLASAPAPVLAGAVAATYSGALVLAWALALATHGPRRRDKAAPVVAPKTVLPVSRFGALPHIAHR